VRANNIVIVYVLTAPNDACGSADAPIYCLECDTGLAISHDGAVPDRKRKSAGCSIRGTTARTHEGRMGSGGVPDALPSRRASDVGHRHTPTRGRAAEGGECWSPVFRIAWGFYCYLDVTCGGNFFARSDHASR